MRLEILFRTGHNYPNAHKSRGRDDETGIWVPITHLWFEGPDDMHIHFGDDENQDNMCHQPYCSEVFGDYLVPDPDHLDSFVKAYSLMVFPEGTGCCRLPKASEDYIKQLRKVWESPNDIAWPETRAAIKEYEGRGR